MIGSLYISSAEFDSAEAKIESLFTDQCMLGPQNRNLGEAKACGQFLKGPSAGADTQPPWLQRGVHGSAAALSVLAPAYTRSTDPTREKTSVNGLIHYILNRKEIEHESLHSEVDEDNKNTIKLCEVLIGCSVLPTDVKSPLIARYVEAILTAKTPSGWSYSLDGTTENADGHILPSSFAINALSIYGKINSDDPVIAWVIGQLRSFLSRQCSISELALATNAIYLILTCSGNILNKPNKLLLKQLWKDTWGKLSPFMIGLNEANIEYSINQRSHYVRIPYQIYAFSLNRIYGLVLRGRSEVLMSIIVKKIIADQPFIYPLSGSRMSTRTYGILLGALRSCRNAEIPLILSCLSWILFILNNIAFHKIAVNIVCGAIFVAGLHYMWLKPDGIGGNFSINVFASVYMLVLAWNKSR
jgi:hypothetical protein